MNARVAFIRRIIKCWLIGIFCLIPLVGQTADIISPGVVSESQIFIITITTTDSDSGCIKLEYDSDSAQYMGALQSTPDIQIKRESLLEIRCDSKFQPKYELKFLPKAAKVAFKMLFNGSEKKIEVTFKAASEEKNYSWWILAAAVLLLIIGLKLFRYQKGAPELMSTKSLFLNFEELEKARKEWFSDNNKEEEKKEDRQEPKTEEASQIHKAQEFDTDDDAETVQNKAVAAKEELIPKEDISAETLKQNAVSLKEDATVKAVAIDDSSATVPRMDANVSMKKEAEAPTNIAAAGQIVCEIIDPLGNPYQGTGSEVKIGRKKENTIVLSASEVSRNHLLIFTKGNEFWAKALTSSNISKVADKDIGEGLKITEGDFLNLGGTEYRIRKLERI